MQPSSSEHSTRLCDFLQERHEDILAHWERTVRSSAHAAPLTSARLRDHIPVVLDRIAAVIRMDKGRRAASLDDLPDLHALDRLETGFDLRAVAGELALLRGAALELWAPHARGVDTVEVVDEIRRFDEAVDEVVARSVDRYARARERTLLALDRVSSAALGTGDLETFLPRLLQVLLETTAAADSAYVMLRAEEDADLFRVCAAVGADAERSNGFAVRTGEGFAGEIARRREPLLVHDASTDPLILNPALRSDQVHAVYGVPLVQSDEVVGIAKLASRSAYDFSDDDKQLLRTMAQRATSIIVQAQLVARERQALEAASRSAAELQRLMEVSPDMLAVIGADGTVRRVNPAFAEVLGYSEAELLGTQYTQLIYPADREKVGAAVETVLEGHPAHRFTFRSLRKDGSVRWTSYNASALPGSDALVAVGRDVTEERERSELEQQLIGIVSHDLRSPLSTIALSCTALLRRAQEIDQRTLKAVARIHSASDRATALIRDLLDFTRARTAGGITVYPQPMDLHQHVRRVAQEVHAAYPDRSLSFEQRGECEGFWDPDRIAQIVENLVSNAFKYGAPEAAVVVRTLGGDRWVRFEVHNRGQAIDPELLPHIFEPLRQGRRVGGVGGVAGVGLGLYIVDHLVRAHGGTIDVHSSAADGTTFMVRLPREPPVQTQTA